MDLLETSNKKLKPRQQLAVSSRQLSALLALKRGARGAAVTKEVSAKLEKWPEEKRPSEAAWPPGTCGHPPAPAPELPGEWPQMTGDEVNGATRVHCPKGEGPQFPRGGGILGHSLWTDSCSHLGSPFFCWESALGDRPRPQPAARVVSAPLAEQAGGPGYLLTLLV